jgi:hydroxymethylglutaryl-CoA lyase
LPLRDKFDIAVGFLSASEQHNRHNVNMSVADSLGQLEKTFGRARSEKIRTGAVIATSFGCPYEGVVPAERVLELVRNLVEIGVEEVAFGDTTGMANPLQVRDFFAAAAEAAPEIELTAHFHNTRGQGLANALAALEAGCRSFESSIGELGGCPVPPGATGNIASEDLIAMLHEMGFQTGIDLESLLETAGMMRDLLARPLGSHVLQAGPIDWGGRGQGGLLT